MISRPNPPLLQREEAGFAADEDSPRLFAALDVYRDITSRSAAMNMAIDEALLQSATVPTARFYRWDHPALSFGYFGKFADVSTYQSKRDIVRRWTGGGIVFHGDDLTYSIVIPASSAVFCESSISIYERTHAAIRAALTRNGEKAELSPGVDDCGSTVNSAGAMCFTNPVRSDVIRNGQKIAGAAQRRNRAGLLQQGSIQNVDLPVSFENELAGQLSARFVARQIEPRLLEQAQKIAENKYGNPVWLRKR